MAGRPSELKYVETPLLEQLKKLGWTVVQLDDSKKHDSQKSFRESFSEVVIVSHLKAALKRLNPWLNDVQVDDLCGLAPAVRTGGVAVQRALEEAPGIDKRLLSLHNMKIPPVSRIVAASR